MKLIGRFKNKSYDQYGNNEITFVIGKEYANQLDRLETERMLSIEVLEKLNQRTLEQNRLIWALMGEIDTKQNGRKSSDSVMELYKALIQIAMIHVEYVKFDKNALKIMKRSFRVVEIIKEEILEGKAYISANLYRGSSDFDTNEMSQFVETILDYASRVGVEISYYDAQLRSLIDDE